MRSLVLLLAAAVSAFAGPLTYTISVTPSTGVLPFTTVFTAADFITTPTIPADYSPITLTNGTISDSLTKALVTSFPGTGCFLFGNAITNLSPCSVSGGPGSSGVALLLPTDLPTALGTYNFSFVGGFLKGSDTTPTSISGTGFVTITGAVPEPATALLLLPALALLASKRRGDTARNQ